MNKRFSATQTAGKYVYMLTQAPVLSPWNSHPANLPDRFY